MISIELLLKHMAWANQEIYKAVQKLDSEVLDYYIVDPEWHIKRILIHTVFSSHAYEKRLAEVETKVAITPPELNNPDSPEVIDELLNHLKRIDTAALKYVDMEDKDIHWEINGEPKTTKASTLLSQMIFHSAEHRAQVVAALDDKGVRDINLDEYSVWSYINSTK
jgi:uncharacterized damage-inducible protein DinB